MGKRFGDCCSCGKAIKTYGDYFRYNGAEMHKACVADFSTVIEKLISIVRGHLSYGLDRGKVVVDFSRDLCLLELVPYVGNLLKGR